MKIKLVVVIVGAFLVGASAAALLASIWGPSVGTQQIVSVGRPLIGGPFTLTNHQGKRVRDADFRGKVMMVYFGYTHCPDVCPAGLQRISAALDAMGDNAKDIVPIFISVDPERDTSSLLAKYVPHFHKSFVGLTGSAEEIRSVAKAYRVYYAKVKGDAEDDYLMDHSSIIYVMDKKGKYLTHFSHGTNPETIAQKLTKLLS